MFALRFARLAYLGVALAIAKREKKVFEGLSR
jgi:hypothetical protein